MRTVTWKAVFAAMSPSPVFQAVAEFAELRVDQRRRALLKRIGDINNGSPVAMWEPPERHRSPLELIF
jgi:hypothetical protein